MAGAVDFVAPRPLAVTIGNYLLMYTDGRFTRHPRFRYFALNTEMCWRALQAGQIYVRQHPHDAQLFFFDYVNMVVIHQYTIIVLQSQALKCNVYIGMFAQALPPQCPAFSLVYIITVSRQTRFSCITPDTAATFLK